MRFDNRSSTTESRSAPLESEQFDPHTEWRNYGDFNPERHGGLFIRWDSEHTQWEVVHTQHADSLNRDRTEEDQLVRTLTVTPSHIWSNPTQSDTEYTPTGAEINNRLFRPAEPRSQHTLTDITHRFVTVLATQSVQNRSDKLNLTDRYQSGNYGDIISSYGVPRDTMTAFNNSPADK